MHRLPAAVGFGLALLTCALPLHADDGWNPFAERDRARQRERATTPRPPEGLRPSPPPTLPPMEGVSSRPWLRDSSRSPEAMPDDDDRAGRSSSWDQPGRPAPSDVAPHRRPDEESVQRSELQPLAPTPGDAAEPIARTSAEPATDLWQGLDQASLGELIAPLSLPPKSEALATLWQRLLSSSGGSAREGHPGGRQRASFGAVRMEALYRSGLIADLRNLMQSQRPAASDALESLLVARTHIALGEREPGCSAIKGLQQAQSSFPKPARQQFLLLAALCGVGAGDTSKASIAADLLRAEGIDAPLAIAALAALASGQTAGLQLPPGNVITLIDYRFLELVGADPDVAAAEPALLTLLALGAKRAPIRILAAESALALHAIQPSDLAAAYRSPDFPAAALAHPFTEEQSPPLQRALLFKAFETERAPVKEARLARALLNEVRRTGGPYRQVAAMLAPAIAELRPSPDLAWFTESAIEICLAGNRLDALRNWVSAAGATGPAGFDDWLVLADIAATNWNGRRGAFLPAAERRAVKGELPPELMHRLVTVLDALDYQIPIPLWEAASRTQQPTGGFLPETGILSRLQNAARDRQKGTVVLLAMRALGPESGDTAHIIALGDTIRALKRAGLEAHARQLGLEALFAAWPRRRAD